MPSRAPKDRDLMRYNCKGTCWISEDGPSTTERTYTGDAKDLVYVIDEALRLNEGKRAAAQGHPTISSSHLGRIESGGARQEQETKYDACQKGRERPAGHRPCGASNSATEGSLASLAAALATCDTDGRMETRSA